SSLKAAHQLAQRGWRFTAPGSRGPFDDPIEYSPDRVCQSIEGNHFLIMRGPDGTALRAYSPLYVEAAEQLYGGSCSDRLSLDQLTQGNRQLGLRVAAQLLGNPGLAVETALADLAFSQQLTSQQTDSEEATGAAFAMVSKPVEGTTQAERQQLFTELHQGVSQNFRPEVYRRSLDYTQRLYELLTAKPTARLGEVTSAMANLVTRLDPKDWQLALDATARAAEGPNWASSYLRLRELAERRPVDETVAGLRDFSRRPLEVHEEADAVWIGSVRLELD
ncbi:MAG: hypothetical protein KC910_23855, partial [Candidatus Eremiobacteraeota bacterium]|nr:hypothetical protein [Candidatus Eremiobacteraeota bacterium]